MPNLTLPFTLGSLATLARKTPRLAAPPDDQGDQDSGSYDPLREIDAILGSDRRARTPPTAPHATIAARPASTLTVKAPEAPDAPRRDPLADIDDLLKGTSDRPDVRLPNELRAVLPDASHTAEISNEAEFQQWYAGQAKRQGLNPNPDDPRHFYDYRAAHAAGAEPDMSGHWPSAFKKEGHPRMIVDGINTKTGERVAPPVPSLLPGRDPATSRDVQATFDEATRIPASEDDVRATMQRIQDLDKKRQALVDMVPPIVWDIARNAPIEKHPEIPPHVAALVKQVQDLEKQRQALISAVPDVVWDLANNAPRQTLDDMGPAGTLGRLGYRARPLNPTPAPPPAPRLGSAKTGGMATEPPAGQGILDPAGHLFVDMPIEGVEQAARGASALGSAALNAPANVPVMARSRTGRMYQSAAAPAIQDSTLNAASDVIEGAFKVGTPLLVPAFIANPLITGAVLVAGGAAQQGAESGAEALGATPPQARFVGNLAAIIAGTAAHVGVSSTEGYVRGKVGGAVEPDAQARAAAAAVLGVDPHATPETLKTAYREAARANHPDINPGADPSAMADINLAYEWLTDHPTTKSPATPRRSVSEWARSQVDWLKSKLQKDDGVRPEPPTEPPMDRGNALPGDVLPPPEPPGPDFAPVSATPPEMPPDLPTELGPNATTAPARSEAPVTGRTVEEEALYEASKAERVRAAANFKQTSVAAKDNATAAVAPHPLEEIDRVLAGEPEAKPVPVAEEPPSTEALKPEPGESIVHFQRRAKVGFKAAKAAAVDALAASSEEAAPVKAKHPSEMTDEEFAASIRADLEAQQGGGKSADGPRWRDDSPYNIADNHAESTLDQTKKEQLGRRLGIVDLAATLDKQKAGTPAFKKTKAALEKLQGKYDGTWSELDQHMAGVDVKALDREIEDKAYFEAAGGEAANTARLAALGKFLDPNAEHPMAKIDAALADDSAPPRTVKEIDKDLDAIGELLEQRSPGLEPEAQWNANPDLRARHRELMAARATAPRGKPRSMPEAAETKAPSTLVAPHTVTAGGVEFTVQPLKKKPVTPQIPPPGGGKYVLPSFATDPHAKPALAREIAGATPRYNVGRTSYSPEFESDVDKAAYILAQKKPSKRDADYLKFVQQATGLDEAGARALGGHVRDRLKSLAKAQPKGGALKVPAIERTDSGRSPETSVTAASKAPSGQWFVDTLKAADPAMSKPSTPTDQATVTKNAERSSVEIKFQEKPSDEARAKLKAAGFRWAKNTGTWFKKAGPGVIDATEQQAHDLVGSDEPPTAETPPPPREEQQAEEPRSEKKETADEKRKRLRDERKKLFDQLRGMANKLSMNIDPEGLMIVAKILRNYAEDGLNEFADAARQFVEDFGAGARKLDRAFEIGWQKWHGEDRKVADVLDAITVTPHDLPGDLGKVQARAIAALEKDPDGFKARYTKEFGRVLNADNASELFGEYAKSEEARATLGAAVRAPAAALVDALYRDILAGPAEAPLGVFTAGGNASGKSSGVSDERSADFIFDSTLSSYEPSKANIERALEAGRDAQVRYVWRDPVRALVDGALPRAMGAAQGRTVTVRGMAATHIGSRDTVLGLAKAFQDDPRVTFVIRQNVENELKSRDLKWLEGQAYDDRSDLEDRLYAALEKAHAAGDISDAVYDGTKGIARAAREGDRGDGRGVQKERGEEPSGSGSPEEKVVADEQPNPRQPRPEAETALGDVPAEDDGGPAPAGDAGEPPARDRAADARAGGNDDSAGHGTRPSTRDDAGDRIPAGGRQRSRASGLDYRIADGDPLGDVSETRKLSDNLAALTLLHDLQTEGRKATPEEQQTLVRYVGWGGLASSFRPGFKGYDDIKALVRNGVITAAERDAMQASTPNAHYTSRAVVTAMYDAVKRLGLTKGRILEPSTGAGHFFGLMPEALADASTWAGVELDPVTAKIAQQLYQSANIQTVGFEKAHLPANFFDLAIGNPPFGNYPVHDPKFTGARKFLTKALHNYFFAKTLDHVRSGGLVAFVTSHYTMDAKDSGVRSYLDRHAELLGAIRLPNTAFKRNAGTEVVTDILFLKKRAAEHGGEPSPWVQTAETAAGTGKATINQYFVDHPEMVLGTHDLTGSMYSDKEYTVEPSGDLAAQLAEAIAHLPESVIADPVQVSADRQPAETIPAPGHVKPFAFAEGDDGKLFVRDGANLVSQEGLPETTKARIRGLMTVRDALRSTMRTMLDPASKVTDVKRAQKALTKGYEKFVAKHGFLSTRGNIMAFGDDPDKPLLLSLEHWDPDREIATKGPIFTKRVLSPRVPVTHADSPQAALLVSLNEQGRVNWDRMAGLTGQTPASLQQALLGQVFETPSGAWQPSDDYLSGDVRAKLLEAKAAAALDPKFKANLDALEKVQPDDLGPKDIDARLGAPWIPPKDIQDFVLHVTGGTARVRYVPPIATWTVTPTHHAATSSVAATEKYGTARKNALDLIDDALNLRQPTVYDKQADGSSTVNQAATLAAREKLQDIKDLFKKWLWEDVARGTRLARYYNDNLNNLRLREYDGSHLTLDGLDAGFHPRPHQKNAIWRTLVSGNTLLAHVVGAGKTFAMVGAAMEMRRLGLAKKPMITVPNHLVEQWGAEFLRAYPTANVLIATKRDFETDRRKRLMARIATGDWDAVIVAHSSFGRVPVSDELFQGFMQEQIDVLERFIEEESTAAGTKSKSVKELEKAKRRLEVKLEQRRNREKQDDTVTFEDLGVDALFVDEAHLFKNLWFPTKMTRVAGLPNSESDRAFDMYLKTRHIQKVTNGRGLVFATGTPISNTMAEMFTMQRYLGGPQLEANGLAHFDAWAQQFGEIVSAMELAPEGRGYRVRNRFARFTNFAELAKQFRSFADVQTAEMLKLPVPALKGGKTTLVAVAPTPTLKAYVDTLVKRAERLRTSKVDPTEDNMLKITGDGRKAALDLRLVGLPQPPGGKLDVAAEKIAAIYKAFDAHKGTQLVFSDLGTPKAEKKKGVVADAANSEFVDDTSGFNVYDALREKLIAAGIPKDEVAFIHDANTDARKVALFADVRSGAVRVLIGSTEKMGAGTNVQDRLVAKHDLDAPWRPSDVEQRDGRIIRQGNLLAATVNGFEVQINRYLAEGSFDAYMWQILESKAKFINQAMSGDINGRSVEDVDVVMISSAAEAKAIASGNPMVFQKVKADAEVAKLQSLKASWDDARWRLRQDLAILPKRIEARKRDLADFEAMRDAVKMPDPWAVTIGTQTFTERKEGGEQLIAAARRTYLESNAKGVERVGSFAGVDIMIGTEDRPKADESIPVSLAHDDAAVSLGAVQSDADPVGWSSRLVNGIEHVHTQLGYVRSDVERLEQRLADSKAEADVPWDRAEKLDAALEEQARLNQALNLDAKSQGQQIGAADDADTNAPDVGAGGARARAPKSDAAVAGSAAPAQPSGPGAPPVPPVPPRAPAGGGATPPSKQPLPDAAGLTQDRKLNLGGAITAIKALINPESLGPDAKGAAGTIRHESAVSFREMTIAREALRDFSRKIDTLPTEKQVEYWDAAERGASTGDPEFDKGNQLLRDITDEFTKELVALDRLKAESTIDNYIGRFWSVEPTRLPDFLRRAIGKRPLEGPKSFLKQRSWERFSQGIRAIQDAQARVKAGTPREGDERLSKMRPATYNYVESQLAKIAEMQRVIAAEKMLRRELEAGRTKKVLDAMGKKPPTDEDGQPWVRLGQDGDPAFTIYGPKKLEVTEAYDAKLMDKLYEFARGLGIGHVRKIKVGGERWGYAAAPHHIVTKFAGPEGVLMHEIGHILDHQYGLKAKWVNNPEYKKELRALADLRFEGQSKDDIPASRLRYYRKGEEKIANLVHAFIYVPDKAKKVAPRAYWALYNLAKDTPALKGLIDIQKNGRSLTLQSNTAEIEVPGFPVVGHWYAPKAAAAVWTNHLSRGMHGNPLYDAYMAPAQAATQILLGLSGFHFTTIAREALNSRLAQTIDALANRGAHVDLSAAARHALTAPAAAATDAAFGRRVMQEYRNPGTHPELAGVLDAMVKGGFRGTAESEFWTGERVEKLKKAFHDAVRAEAKSRRLWGAAKLPLDALWAGMELTMKPLMGKYVPWMKTAATYRAVSDALAQLPADVDTDTLHRVLGDKVKEMDYRYGQVQYDNHFTHRMVKDLAQAVFLAPGWTIGTLAIAARGVRQIGAIPYRAWTKNGDIPKELIGSSAAYWIGGTLAFMFINGLLTYLHTGENPHGKDYFGYRDGTKDNDGNPNRHILPGYEMRDIHGWSTHPVSTFENKLKPSIAFMVRLAHNRDFFGDMLYDPEADLPTKTLQVGQAAVKELGTPLSIQNYREAMHRDEASMAEAARNFFGITPAKREFVRTPAQNQLAEFMGRQGHTARTPDQVAKSDERRDLREAIRQKKTEKATEIEHSGHLSKGQIKAAEREGKETFLQRGFSGLTLEDGLKVYETATPAERGALRMALIKKNANFKISGARADVMRLSAPFRDALRLEWTRPTPAAR